MSLNDNVRSQADYLKAHAALDRLANDLSITDEQRTAALSARTRLSLDFINQAQASIEARTEQYQKFIDAMTATIKELRSGGLADEVKDLSGLVDEGTALLAAVRNAIP